MTTTNRTAGTGQHSHEIPTSEGLVVEIRDGNHEGTSVWLRSDGCYAFASWDRNHIETAERCVLLVGQDLGDGIPYGIPYGCDAESPRGLALVGVSKDDDLRWTSEGAEVLWDSAA